jgi:hypothetical protein
MKTLSYITVIVASLFLEGCTHEYKPEEITNWNAQVTLSFTDPAFWPVGQEVRIGAFMDGENSQPVKSVAINKPSENKVNVSIAEIPEGQYQFKVYITENSIYKADIISLGEKQINENILINQEDITLVTFNRVQKQVLNGCLLCHGGSAGTPAGNLNLMSGTSYAQLVNVAATMAPSMVRVKPGSAAYSFLIKVLDRDINFDHASSSLPSVADKQLIKDWINEGAKNN